MGWGAPLGFSSGKTPFETVSSATPGEPGFYLRLRRRPREGYPDRVVIRFPGGQAVINDRQEATTYLETEQSTSVHAAAAYYLGGLDRATELEHS